MWRDVSVACNRLLLLIRTTTDHIFADRTTQTWAPKASFIWRASRLSTGCQSVIAAQDPGSRGQALFVCCINELGPSASPPSYTKSSEFPRPGLTPGSIKSINLRPTALCFIATPSHCASHQRSRLVTYGVSIPHCRKTFSA